MSAEPDTLLSTEFQRFSSGAQQRPFWFRFCPVAVAEDELIKALGDEFEKEDMKALINSSELARSYPSAAVDRLRSLGLMQLFYEVGNTAPRATAYHFSALDLMAARTTGSFAITIGVNCLALLAAYCGATPEQLERILAHVRQGAFSALALTELEHGSDLSETESFAQPGILEPNGSFSIVENEEDATHYLLRGSRQLINGGVAHPLLFLLLRTSSKGGDKWKSQSLFWIIRDPSRLSARRWPTLPAQAADISDVVLDDVVVEADQLLGNPGDGFVAIHNTLSMSRGGVAALACGCLSRARDLTINYVRNRRLYGRCIGELDGIGAHVARIDALDRIASALSLKATSWVNACGSKAAPYTAAAKYLSCLFAEEGVSEGRRVLGARALLRDLPYEQTIRDVLLYGVFDGTSHIMLDELQAILSREVRRWKDNIGRSVPTLDIARDVYGKLPRSLVEVVRTRPDVQPPSLVVHARNLAALPGENRANLIVNLAELLMATCDASKRHGQWNSDQELRFRMAEVFAMIEGMVSLVEISDPDRRSAVMSRSPEAGPLDDIGYRHALAWLGCRACGKLTACIAEQSYSHRSGVEERAPETARLTNLLVMFSSDLAMLRKGLVQAILSSG